MIATCWSAPLLLLTKAGLLLRIAAQVARRSSVEIAVRRSSVIATCGSAPLLLLTKAGLLLLTKAGLLLL